TAYHGRLETRRCTVAHELDTLGPALKHWPAIETVARIRATREIVNGRTQGECSTEWRYYVSSRILSAEACEAAVRAHWSIENGCRWVLDVQFSEDDSRIRVGDGAENFAILRRISLNLIKQETSSKKSMNSKRLKAGWCTDYLQKSSACPHDRRIRLHAIALQDWCFRSLLCGLKIHINSNRKTFFQFN
ncbi:ISAs1 family transposase, partial [Cupriavidus necator]